jgi:hypothetical protein
MRISRNAVLPTLGVIALLGGYAAWRHFEAHRSTDDACLGAAPVRSAVERAQI